MPSPTCRPKSRLGFTLIELLVVISIIALLISLLLPALGSARAVALSAKCQANLHNMGIAYWNYATDFNDMIPPIMTGDVGPSYPYPNNLLGGFEPAYGYDPMIIPWARYNDPGAPAGYGGGDNAAGQWYNGYYNWAYFIYTYMPNLAAFKDPAIAGWPDSEFGPLTPAGQLQYGDPFLLPLGTAEGIFWGPSYGVNFNPLYYDNYGTWVADMQNPTPYPNVFGHMSHQLNPSGTALVMDAEAVSSFAAPYECLFCWFTYAIPGQTPDGADCYEGYQAPRTYWLGINNGPQDDTFVATDVNNGRHPSKSLNAVMYDGHANSFTHDFIHNGALKIGTDAGWTGCILPTDVGYLAGNATDPEVQYWNGTQASGNTPWVPGGP